MSMFNWWNRKGSHHVGASRVGMVQAMEDAERERLEKIKLEMLAEWEPLDGMAEARMLHDMHKRFEEVTRAIRERDAERRRVEREQMIEEIATRVAAKIKENGAKEAE